IESQRQSTSFPTPTAFPPNANGVTLQSPGSPYSAHPGTRVRFMSNPNGVPQSLESVFEGWIDIFRLTDVDLRPIDVGTVLFKHFENVLGARQVYLVHED